MRYEMILNKIGYDIVDRGHPNQSDYVICRNVQFEDAITITKSLNKEVEVTANERKQGHLFPTLC